MAIDPVSYAIGKKASGGGGSSVIISKNITENGTYNASSDSADGYNPVVVNVSGGGSPDPTKPVKFIDYDGTILYSYTAQEVQALTALPSLPTHQRLVSQGWNWTLSDIKAYSASYPNSDLVIGSMYITASGDTEIDITISSLDRKSPYLNIGLDGEVSIDWGDGSTPDTLSYDYLDYTTGIQHTYSSIGNYTITIHVITGEFSIIGYYASRLLGVSEYTPSYTAEDQAYASCITAVYIGNGIHTISDYAFNSCYNLLVTTIPNTVTTISYDSFEECYNLRAIIIPTSITDIYEYSFSSCYSLLMVSLPNTILTIEEDAFSTCYSLLYLSIPFSVTDIFEDAFSGCYSLLNLTIPDTVTNIGEGAFSDLYKIKSIVLEGNITDISDNVFRYNYSLMSIILPNSLKTMGEQSFYNCNNLSSIMIPNGVTDISDEAFGYCSSLTSITLPSSVTSIGSDVFYYDFSLKSIHILATIPPTLSGNLWGEISSDLVIYVPTASVDTYKSAEGWSTYADLIVGE